jgi:hypothetical protein
VRLVFVNHLHPETGLVGALRMWRFAEELALRGHQIVFLCATHRIADDARALEARLMSHQWAQPLLVACGPRPLEDPRASAPRGGAVASLAQGGHVREPEAGIPRVERMRRFSSRVRTAWDLVVRGGPFWSWRQAAQQLYGPLCRQFKPQLAFATFADLDSLNIARDLATECAIPWVLDIKDATDAFVPPALRWLIARRYRDAAAVTLNSEYQRRHNPGWSVAEASVIYSGMETVRAGPNISDFNPQIYSLVGAAYSDESLRDLLTAFRSYAETGFAASSPRMRYYGKEESRVAAAAEAAGAQSLIECVGMVARTRMLVECAKSSAVCYVSSPRTFHHKLIELSSLGRPMICYPSESAEALALATRHDLPLWSCIDSAALQRAFEGARSFPTRSMAYLERTLSWSAVASQLESTFQGVLG